LAFWSFFRSRLLSSCRKEGEKGKVVGALSVQSVGVRADKALQLQSAEEGSKVDFFEWIEPK
jgi:hypothetical protein